MGRRVVGVGLGGGGHFLKLCFEFNAANFDRRPH